MVVMVRNRASLFLRHQVMKERTRLFVPDELAYVFFGIKPFGINFNIFKSTGWGGFGDKGNDGKEAAAD
ncbi:MAG: hypothetical protein ACLFQQ_07415 [Desulfococcaceae bacterium]